MILVDLEYPVVYALALERNKLSNTPQFYSVAFKDLIDGFSKLYLPTINTVVTWAREAS